MSLTARQTEAYQIRHSQNPPLSWAEIGRRMGVDASTAREHYEAALKKGKQPPVWDTAAARDALTVAEPLQADQMIDQLSSPFLRDVARAAEAEKLPREQTFALLGRLEKRYRQTKLAVEQAKTTDLQGLLDDRSRRILEMVSEEDILRASLKDKAHAAAMLLDRRQVLRGEPTQIIGHEDRRHMTELMKALFAEAQRRGIEIDVTDQSRRLDVAEGEC